MGHSDLDPAVHERRPWNAGQNVGPKRPLRPRDIWAIRFYLDEHKRLRDRALFDLAIDSKLRGCDLVKLRIGDVVSGGHLRNRATVIRIKSLTASLSVAFYRQHSVVRRHPVYAANEERLYRLACAIQRRIKARSPDQQFA